MEYWSSNSYFEKQAGYVRVIKIDNLVFVAGYSGPCISGNSLSYKMV